MPGKYSLEAGRTNEAEFQEKVLEGTVAAIISLSNPSLTPSELLDLGIPLFSVKQPTFKFGQIPPYYESFPGRASSDSKKGNSLKDREKEVVMDQGGRIVEIITPGNKVGIEYEPNGRIKSVDILTETDYGRTILVDHNPIGKITGIVLDRFPCKKFKKTGTPIRHRVHFAYVPDQSKLFD